MYTIRKHSPLVCPNYAVPIRLVVYITINLYRQQSENIVTFNCKIKATVSSNIKRKMYVSLLPPL